MIAAEHIFEVSVEEVKGLVLGEDMIWGEADCFIQYHFPTQLSSKQQQTTAKHIDGKFTQCNTNVVTVFDIEQE